MNPRELRAKEQILKAAIHLERGAKELVGDRGHTEPVLELRALENDLLRMAERLRQQDVTGDHRRHE